MEASRHSWIQGASRGIGLEMTRQLLAVEDGSHVFASCRDPSNAARLTALASAHPSRLTILGLDVTDEKGIERAAESISAQTDRLHLVVNVAGVLHGPDFGPEKRLGQIDPDVLRRVFTVNAFGPLLVAKHVHRLLRHDERAVFASLSARVGSISDNRLGGWYAYRGSKAAQNMFTKTIAIELGRVAPKAIVVGLHPGTVDTDLSGPFQRNVPPGQLQSTEQSAASLLSVIARLTPTDTGKVIDFRGDEITP